MAPTRAAYSRRGVKRALVVGLLTLVVAGCGSHETRFGELRVVHTGRVMLRATPRPRFRGPGPNVVDVAFVSRRVGFVATSHHSGEPPAAIQGSARRGGTWHGALLR